jgi:hypothetical protein
MSDLVRGFQSGHKAAMAAMAHAPLCHLFTYGATLDAGHPAAYPEDGYKSLSEVMDVYGAPGIKPLVVALRLVQATYQQPDKPALHAWEIAVSFQTLTGKGALGDGSQITLVPELGSMTGGVRMICEAAAKTVHLLYEQPEAAQTSPVEDEVIAEAARWLAGIRPPDALLSPWDASGQHTLWQGGSELHSALGLRHFRWGSGILQAEVNPSAMEPLLLR